MVPIEDFVEYTIRKIQKFSINQCIDLRTYKRDRSVIIKKMNHNFNVYEDGFVRKEYIGLSINEIEKLLYEIKKREFPRSNIFRSNIYNDKER